MIRYYTISFVLIFLLQGIYSYAQTVAIPDVNLRNKLIADYPFVMSGNLLNIPAANIFGPDLILDNSNISDPSGLEHFTSVYKLNLSDNNLSALPNLTGFTNLQYLYANNNALTALPNLSNLTSLKQLFCGNNQLTALPSLTGLTNLVSLFFSDNQVINFPDLSSQPNLKYLYCGNNSFTALPNLASHPLLIELHCHDLQLTSIPGLSALTNLEVLICWGNKLTDLSGIDLNTSLKYFQTEQNPLESLPTLTNKPNLKSILVHNCRLTVEDLLPLTSISLTVFTYGNQDSCGTGASFSVREKDTLQITSTVETANPSNWFYLLHNGIKIDSNHTGYFIRTPMSIQDTGTYLIKIKNPALPFLSLKHRTWKVSMNSCMDLISYDKQIGTTECQTGGSITLSNLVINGVDLPMQYFLVSKFSPQDSLRNLIAEFSSVPPGMYSFLIADKKNCFISIPVEIKKAKECDPVITPNGDGVSDSYYVEKSGKVKIIGLDGSLIREFIAPGIWDGTRNDGSLVDSGFYVITINNKKLTNVSVVH